MLWKVPPRYLSSKAEILCGEKLRDFGFGGARQDRPKCSIEWLLESVALTLPGCERHKKAVEFSESRERVAEN